MAFPSPQRSPVRTHGNGRPLPVTAVAASPGPAYDLGSTLGKGPQITLKHRYVEEEELMPMPGPGEYDPPAGYKWRKAPGYSFSAPQVTREKSQVPREKPPTRDEVTRSEPGPGYYTNDTLDISKRPSPRTGWRVQDLDDTNPKKLMYSGTSIASPPTKRKPADGVPGPGSYNPVGDNKGGRNLGQQPRNKNSSMKVPARSEKRTDDMAAPGPGAYDTTRFDIAKRAQNHPVSMPGRPFSPETEYIPGPGHYGESYNAKQIHGPKFVPAPPPRTARHSVPGPGEYDIKSTIGTGRPGVTFKHRHSRTARSPRCPHLVGSVVAVMLSSAGPALKGTVKESWNGETEDTATCYRVLLDTGIERDVEGCQVATWDDKVGPGAYEPQMGVGKGGPKYTIQGPCSFTSMAVSESRKTRDNPGPDHYFKNGKMPKNVGDGGKKVTIGHRVDSRHSGSDVGPGGGPSGSYQPKHPSEFQPYTEFTKGVSMGGRGKVMVQVLSDVDVVRQLCDESGVTEWKGGKEWTGNRHGYVEGSEVCKDDYCGMEGLFVQQGGVIRGKAPTNVTGPNRDYAKKVPNAPWSAWRNRSRGSIRVRFEDGVVWTYPPSALTRHGLPFDKANRRWPIPQTDIAGPPVGISSSQFNATRPIHSVTISGRRESTAKIEDSPGPGQYHLAPSLSTRGAVIGTGQ